MIAVVRGSGFEKIWESVMSQPSDVCCEEFPECMCAEQGPTFIRAIELLAALLRKRDSQARKLQNRVEKLEGDEAMVHTLKRRAEEAVQRVPTLTRELERVDTERLRYRAMLIEAGILPDPTPISVTENPVPPQAEDPDPLKADDDVPF